uniref:Uncharacterized protein n=1 Tax=Lactuca sativa TaxID=4236 RepID=A0A9R1XJ05_LACSA|nr:hypothetical protein LSAT_V11C400163670 [Lactuca sativa]
MSLKKQTLDEPPALPKAAHDAWLKHIDDSLDVSCLMLAFMEKPISKLHVMLKTIKKNIPRKTPQVLIIREGKVKKNKGKNFKGNTQAGKGKGKKAPKTHHQRRRKRLPNMTHALSVVSWGIRNKIVLSTLMS